MPKKMSSKKTRDGAPKQHMKYGGKVNAAGLMDARSLNSDRNQSAK